MLPMSVVKDYMDIIASFLTHIYINLSIFLGIFPDLMKIARVVLLFKSGIMHSQWRRQLDNWGGGGEYSYICVHRP